MKNNLYVILFLFSSLIPYFGQDASSNSLIENASALNLISVTIGGDFITNGTFKALRTERVDEFVTRIYEQSRNASLSMAKDSQSLQEIMEKVESFATRNILLKRMNGTELFIDLEQFRLSADFSNNPYLVDGDVLIFPKLDLKNNAIFIYGAINNPGAYQYVEGDKLSDAIFIAGGWSEGLEGQKSVNISRLDITGNKEELFKLNPHDDMELRSGDRIYLTPTANHKRDYKVLLLGEVKNPGYVFITKENTTLKELIDRAGGLKKNADLDRAEFLRPSNSLDLLKIEYVTDYLSGENVNRLLELERMRTLDSLHFARSSMLFWHEQLNYPGDYLMESENMFKNINFNLALKNHGESEEVILRDGDVVLIPEIFNKVYLYGQIKKIGYYEHIPGKNYIYYIGKAGGLTEQAREEDRIFLIKRKTNEWISLEEGDYSIEPGDYIYVPKEIPKDFNYYVNQISQYAGIIGSIATIVVLLIQVTK